MIFQNLQPNPVAIMEMPNNMISETFLCNNNTNFSGLNDFAGPSDSIVSNKHESKLWLPPPAG